VNHEVQHGQNIPGSSASDARAAIWPVGVVRQNWRTTYRRSSPEVGAQSVPRTAVACAKYAHSKVNVLHERELGVLRTADVIDLRIDWVAQVPSANSARLLPHLKRRP